MTSTADPEPPSFADDALGDRWALVEDDVETLIELSAVRVRGATRRYEDEQSREALCEATDGAVDTAVRFLAGTRLGFEPPLPPFVSPAMVLPTLRNETHRAFADRLRERGLVDVERSGSQRIRAGTSRRARLVQFTAGTPPDGGHPTLSLVCWVATWTQDGAVLIATGSHPDASLAEQFDLDTDEGLLTRSRDSYREEFLSLVRTLE